MLAEALLLVLLQVLWLSCFAIACPVSSALLRGTSSTSDPQGLQGLQGPQAKLSLVDWNSWNERENDVSSSYYHYMVRHCSAV